MGEIRPPEAAKLVVGILASDPALVSRVESEFVERFGRSDESTDLLPFRFTDYYAHEMGPNLVRKFLAFERLIDPAEIATIKRWTNAIESRASGPAKRPINLDPGYVTLSKLVLASTKNYSHRIYLGDGIYAEITLAWSQGAFTPKDWTYPDYRTAEYLEFFNRVRRRLHEQRDSGPG